MSDQLGEKMKAIAIPYLRGLGCEEDCSGCEHEADDIADQNLVAIKEDGWVKLGSEEDLKAELIQIDRAFGRDKTGENRNTYRARRLNLWLRGEV